MERKGICTNVGPCTMANKVQIITDDDAEFKCRECGEELKPYEEDKVNPGGDPKKTKRLVSIIVAAVVLIGIIVGLIFALGGSKKPEKVVLNQSSLTLKVGATGQLTATLEPEGAESELEWKSSDESIVSVSANGTVTAVKEGTAKVMAKAVANEKARAVCDITVEAAGEPGNPDDVQTIAINENELTLKPGGKQRLSLTITPETHNEGVNWESSNPDVVRVSPTGEVTAIRTGEVTITAKTDRTGKEALATVIVEGHNAGQEGQAVGGSKQGSSGSSTSAGGGGGGQNPSWGTYTGGRKNGKPDGNGVLRITKQHSINGQMAQPGERIEGVFRDGYVNMGTWFKNDGNAVVVKDVKVI